MKKFVKCSIDGCDKPARARTWCIKHYRLWQRHGDPLGSAFSDAETQFWKKVGKTDGCWIWTAARYSARTCKTGFFNVLRDGKRKPIAARILAWEYLNGPIAEGVRLIPNCLNDLCVNPDHMSPGGRKPNSENRRGPQQNSTTGVRGVFRFRNRLRAQVGHNGKTVHVGIFDTLEEAEAAVIAKRLELHTHNFADRKRA